MTLKVLLFIIGVGVIAFTSTIIPTFFGQDSFAAIMSSVKNAPPLNEVPQNSVPQDWTNRPAEPATTSEEVPGLPVALMIPAVNVHAVVEYVGITSDGAMGVPSGPAGVAWLKSGPRPGEIGTAVMSGHYGWKNGLPAAFDNLHQLQIGDNVYVRDDQGATSTFIVRDIRTYRANEDAANVFYSSDGLSHLNLITCEGTWNKAKKSYSDRLVIFTVKE